MPNNILANKKQAGVAILTRTFAELNINNSTKIKKIFLVDSNTPINAYDPLSTFNGINGFVAGKGYEILAKVDLDLTGIVSPPNLDGIMTFS